MSIESPCIDVCRMNPDTGQCDGCFRTLEEIIAWSRADEGEKRRILAAVAERERAAARVPAAPAGARP